VHGGSSGIGTAAIQLARWRGARALVTCGSARKGEACLALGAAAWFDYKGDWPAAVSAAGGADVILDIVGASNLGKNIACLNTRGRLVIIGTSGGSKGELDLGRLLQRRLTVMGTTLRSRPVAEKALLSAQIVRELMPAFASGALHVVVDRVLPISAAAEAHRVLEASEHIGKIVLEMP
jgi:NADPH:quinone reductase-like Zn-dependent oxidoreductase